MNRLGGSRRGHFPLPDRIARRGIEAEHEPADCCLGGGGAVAAEVEATARSVELIFGHGGREPDAVAPDDRRRPAPAGNLADPGQVFPARLAVGEAPAVGQAGVVGANSPASRATELWPMVGSGLRRGGKAE
jgi:hypothetical protein